MSEPFIGEIRMFAGNFAPRGWAFCNGQLLAISTNSALFSILGTTYGGNGVQTFGLPDLRGRAPVHSGNQAGPGLPIVNLGELSGNRTVTLTQLQMPAHNHSGSTSIAIPTGSGDANASAPSNTSYLAKSIDAAGSGGDPVIYNTTAAPGQTLAPFNAAVTVGIAGGSQPVDITNPYLGLNFIIATEGIYPSRN